MMQHFIPLLVCVKSSSDATWAADVPVTLASVPLLTVGTSHPMYVSFLFMWAGGGGKCSC